MENFEQSMDEIKAALLRESPFVGLQYDGIATHIYDMQHFYIVPRSIYRLMSVLEIPGNHLGVPDLYNIVIYLSPTLGHHARGTVMKVRPDGSCVMFAMDYGVTDANITSGNIFTSYNEDAIKLPGLAQCCELAMCFPRGSHFSYENIESFKFFMGEEREKLAVTIREVNPHKLAVLIMSSRTNPDDVSMVLGYTGDSVLYAGPL